ARGNSPGTRCTETGAKAPHWDGRWHADCPAPTSHDSDSPYGDKSAWRCPPCGDVGGSGAPARAARRKVLWNARCRAHIGHNAAFESSLRRALACWGVDAWAEVAHVRGSRLAWARQHAA